MIPASRQRNYLQSALYVIIAAILAAILLERLLTYLEAAEKVAMEVTVSNLRSGLYAQLAQHVLKGEMARAEALEHQSPFAATSTQSDNYLGEFDGPPSGPEPSGQWYFDRQSRELIYRPNLDRYFVDPRPPAARFKVRLEGGGPGRYTGIRLLPVEPYRWEPLP